MNGEELANLVKEGRVVLLEEGSTREDIQNAIDSLYEASKVKHPTYVVRLKTDGEK